MDPLLALAAAKAALALAQELAPIIQRAVASGQITAAEQSELQAQQKAVAASFSGPEWQIV